MRRIKIRIPKPRKGYVKMVDIKRLNPNLQIVRIRKKYRLIK